MYRDKTQMNDSIHTKLKNTDISSLTCIDSTMWVFLSLVDNNKPGKWKKRDQINFSFAYFLSMHLWTWQCSQHRDKNNPHLDQTSSHIQEDNREQSSTNNYSQVGFGWAYSSITPLKKHFGQLAQCCVNLNTSGDFLLLSKTQCVAYF